jgi:hypothetical protein
MVAARQAPDPGESRGCGTKIDSVAQRGIEIQLGENESKNCRTVHSGKSTSKEGLKPAQESSARRKEHECRQETEPATGRWGCANQTGTALRWAQEQVPLT